MAASHRLIVGARGWDHAGWRGAFYPEDLPQEWRLTYYANEFTGVLVPESVWRAADPETIAIWCDDVTDGFLFFLELQDPNAAELPAVPYQDLFASHWGGVPVASEALMPADENWNLRCVRERFEHLMLQPLGVTSPGFFLCGDPPNIDHMREARLLADML